MVRAAILGIVLAILANAGCFGSCATNTCAQPSGSCHHNQKKSMEPCSHHPLIADDSAEHGGYPLTQGILVAAALPHEWIPSRRRTEPSAVAPSPPTVSSSVTILKI